MPKGRLSTCLDIGYLKREVEELLANCLQKEPAALAGFMSFHPTDGKLREVSLTDGQTVLARPYRFEGWKNDY
jgi:hypothetical protein